jgi:hypothetical protein
MNLESPTGCLRIEAPHYVAAAEWVNGRCVKAAPILAWMIGKPWPKVHAWLFNKRYHWQWVGEYVD